MKLSGNSRHLAKDQMKSNMATKFIGVGATGSSTESYRHSWGSLANCGKYTKEDVVFVSINGARFGRLSFPQEELLLAIRAGATILTDSPYDRERSYNIGEREVANFLAKQGYEEKKPGVWTKIGCVAGYKPSI